MPILADRLTKDKDLDFLCTTLGTEVPQIERGPERDALVRSLLKEAHQTKLETLIDLAGSAGMMGRLRRTVAPSTYEELRGQAIEHFCTPGKDGLTPLERWNPSGGKSLVGWAAQQCDAAATDWLRSRDRAPALVSIEALREAGHDIKGGVWPAVENGRGAADRPCPRQNFLDLCRVLRRDGQKEYAALKKAEPQRLKARLAEVRLLMRPKHVTLSASPENGELFALAECAPTPAPKEKPWNPDLTTLDAVDPHFAEQLEAWIDEDPKTRDKYSVLLESTPSHSVVRLDKANRELAKEFLSRNYDDPEVAKRADKWTSSQRPFREHFRVPGVELDRQVAVLDRLRGQSLAHEMSPKDVATLARAARCKLELSELATLDPDRKDLFALRKYNGVEFVPDEKNAVSVYRELAAMHLRQTAMMPGLSDEEVAKLEALAEQVKTWDPKKESFHGWSEAGLRGDPEMPEREHAPEITQEHGEEHGYDY